mgnify:CR=1 FL=1
MWAKRSSLLNTMQWGAINYQTLVLIVDKVDVLSKDNQLWLRSFIDDWQHHALILLISNYIGKFGGIIRNRLNCMEDKGSQLCRQLR